MNIEEVQRRLWDQSQAHKQNRESGTPMFPTNPYGGRIRNLMDLMHNPTWIAAACDRVVRRSRGKASGVDGVTVCQVVGMRGSEWLVFARETPIQRLDVAGCCRVGHLGDPFGVLGDLRPAEQAHQQRGKVEVRFDDCLGITMLP